MPVEFTCDGCDRRLRAPDAKAGKRVNCPTCGKDLLIPVMSTTAPISLPSAGSPLPNPLDKLAAAIPTAAEAAAFKLDRPGAAPAPNLNPPTTPLAKPNPPAQLDIGLADEPPKPTVASSSGSSSGIGGSLKIKPNAWRGGDKAPAVPNLTPKPAMPAQPAAPLSIPMANAPYPGPAAASPFGAPAPAAPVPVAANPLDDIFKDLPQLQPISPTPQNPNQRAVMFPGLAPVTTVDPFQAQGAVLPNTAPRWDQIASTANVGSSNPYSAPLTSSAGGYRGGANIDAVRTRVVVPGVFLLVCYILWTLYFIVNLFANGFTAVNIFMNESQDPEKTGYAVGIVFVSVLFFAIAVSGLAGSISMIRVRKWGSALAAAIVAIFPCLFCFPIGIWAVVVLSQEDVKRAFEANDRRAERNR
jgi:hypothetical protein